MERTAAPIVHRRAITADELEMSADVDKAAIARARKQAKIAAARKSHSIETNRVSRTGSLGPVQYTCRLLQYMSS